MITDFKEWFDELKDNKLWTQRMKEMFPRKNLTRIAMEVHAWLLAKEDDRDMPSTRALFQTFANKAADGTAMVNVVVDEPVKDTWKPVSWEERAKYLEQFQKMVDASPMMKPAFKPTSQQAEEEGGVRPKSVPFVRSEVEKIVAAKQVVKDAQNARRKFFLDAYPDAEEEEIQAYISQFTHIDNPDSI
jgi:hypothetical protein